MTSARRPVVDVQFVTNSARSSRVERPVSEIPQADRSVAGTVDADFQAEESAEHVVVYAQLKSAPVHRQSEGASRPLLSPHMLGDVKAGPDWDVLASEHCPNKLGTDAYGERHHVLGRYLCFARPEP